MTTKLIEIATPDGPCKTELALPSGSGPHPLVLVFFDAGGLRPAQTRIAERIASWGYVVLQPDLFHRAKPLEEFLGEKVTLESVRKVFVDAELRGKFMSDFYMPATSYENIGKTVGAVLDHASKMPEVEQGKVGTTGYCMGGNVSIRNATVFGDRITAAAAFHPGGLVTDSPDSPHKHVKNAKARLYFGPAEGDLPPEAEAKLKAELDAAHVKYEIEHYAAKHGYAVDDAGDDYSPAAAARHYVALEKLFKETLH